ncbi:MAG: LysR family transcriptional regulator [Marinobacter sp.]|uniref:LysR family transcriptional regulator n=1 Tax=Marinobacter sp. TaxID=50741 RepID=UPI00299DE710|nr:LysR family transcriptional regulator [Marinobacter sp.]MDX1757183.1 LysR family transcriptional regulator [Marinobacter sp.]
MHIQLEKLRSFVLIAEEKNLTRAAQRRHSTPAAVSTQLRQLEEALNLQLFERTSKGMVLTEAGLKVLPLAYRILGNLAELETTARAIAGNRRSELLLGLNALPELLRIESVLETTARDLPEVSLVVKSSNSVDIQRAVLDGELDVGFVYGGHEAETLKRRVLGHIRVVTIAPLNRGLDRLPDSASDLACLPWVAPSPSCPYIDLLRERLGVHYPAANVATTSDDEYSTIAMVKAGLGIGLVAEHLADMAAARNEIRVFPQTAATLSLYLVTRRDRCQQVPELAAFTRLVEAQWLGRALADRQRRSLDEPAAAPVS